MTQTVADSTAPVAPAGPAAGGHSRLRGLLRGGSLVVAAQAAVMGGSFFRNLILARFVTKADFGIAGMIAMWLSLGELFGDMGVGRCLVRSPENDEEGLLGTAHAFTVLLFLTMGTVLLLGGGVAAEMMGKNLAPYSWAFRTVGMVLWIRAFTHCGAWRTQRSMRFGPMATAQAVSQGAGVLCAAPVALALRDYRAMIVLAAINALVFVITTHAVSPQKYRISLVPRYGRAFWTFGAPLVADGMLMFLLFNGERIIVSRTQTDDMLGAYTAAYQLAFAPTMLLANTALGIGIPEFANAHDDASRNRRYTVLCGLLGVCIVGGAIPMVLGGGELVRVVFGAKYAGYWAIMAALAAGQGFRVLRIAPTVRAMERGDTLLPFVCNLIRAASLLPAWLAARAGQGIWVALAIGAAGEALAALACTIGVGRRWSAAVRPNIIWTVAYAGVVGACVLLPAVIDVRDRFVVLPLSIVAGGLVGAVGLWLIPGLREELGRIRRLLRSKRMDTQETNL